MLDEKRPQPKPGYQVETLDGEIVLFHPAQREIFHSNSTGALVWQLCDGERNVGQIIDLLCQTYPNAADRIPDDVRQTLQTFAQHGAIQWR